METATKDAMELQGKQSKSAVHKVKSQKPKVRFHQQKLITCYSCNKQGHKADEYRFKDQTCHKCKKKGHIQAACRSKMVKWNVHSPNADDSQDDEVGIYTVFANKVTQEGNNDVGIYTVNSKTKEITIDVKFDNKSVKMEVDTGSALSIIPTKEFDQMSPNRKLDSTDVILRTFSGEKFTPLGVTAVNVNYNDQSEILSLYVVQKRGGILFGRDWLRKIRLDWIKINKVSVENVNKKTKELLDQHSSVFNDNIGCVNGITGNLIMKDNVKPVFMKARPIPYALRPKVEQELDRLEEEGIISKVPTSEWATPIVPVVKRSGGVRICGDFKVTTNQQLQVDQYPLPRIDNIFASLSRGEKFSKIDLRQAYLQLEMNEESKKYLTINTHRGLYQYNRMLFSVASAPAIWQRTIDQILQGLTGVQCILDDMVITGRNDRSRTFSEPRQSYEAIRDVQPFS
ncbi:unnamed protein product [Mytilus coruscus]|uniref:CCHC-type domain-containing protein n=1 Tax=Mytilus coruscus TaxID=42192 RepID=A0A6J8A0Z9_MYTCO|nr:unnamed protein product [Mytilus coruscus]